MRIGILGGTFNPIHIGHLILAEEAREKLKLGRLIFVPTYLPPHKDSRDIAAAGHRYAMIAKAIADNPYFQVSDIEIKRDGKSYTIDTVTALKELYRKDELYFIIGSDLLTYLEEWKDLRDILRMVKFIAATRPGYPLENIPSYITTLPIRAVDISAFEIRQAIRQGHSFRYLVPQKAYDYIVSKKLYSS